MLPHFSYANLNKRTKSMLFFLRQIADKRIMFLNLILGRLKYDVIA